MKILIPEQVAQLGKDYLLERGYEVIDNRISSKQELMEQIGNCDGLLIRTMICDRDVLLSARKLKVIAKHGVGVDNIDVAYCTDNDIQVTFTPLAVTESVAEHALFLMFACAKNAIYTVRHFLDCGDFETRNKLSGVELAGKTVGVLGLGRIGKAIACKCVGIGMRVVGYDPYISQKQAGKDIELADRDSVLRNADFVSMNLPCNDETRGAFGTREFGLMKKTAFFVNVSRGGVVQETALIDALNRGEILGAGIDVFECEPPGLNNPLLHMENVYATPHQAGSTVETINKVSLHAAMGIDEALSKKQISWPLNEPRTSGS